MSFKCKHAMIVSRKEERARLMGMEETGWSERYKWKEEAVRTGVKRRRR